jgi:hypothetical protein
MIVTINIQPEDEAVFKRLKSNGRITHRLRRLMTQQWNKCSVCGSHILEGRPAFAGYDLQSNPLFVGACCSSNLQELATPVYWSDSLNLSVDDSQAVWRYMDFAKFVAMLQHRGIYLSRADRFDDRFEGATGLAARQANWDGYYLDFFRKLVVTPPASYPIPDYTAEQIEAEANRLLKSIKIVALDARKLLVSCWHGNETESACAQYYGAIVGRVHYVDFKYNFAAIQNERIFQKRKSLSHEQEVRIVLPNERKLPFGLHPVRLTRA